MIMQLVTSTVGRKILVAISGQLMVLFVVAHLMGNSSIFIPGGINAPKLWPATPLNLQWSVFSGSPPSPKMRHTSESFQAARQTNDMLIGAEMRTF